MTVTTTKTGSPPSTTDIIAAIKSAHSLQALHKCPPHGRLGHLHRPSDLPGEIAFAERVLRIFVRTPLWRLPLEYMPEHVDAVNRYACVVALMRLKTDAYKRGLCDLDFGDYVLDKRMLAGELGEHDGRMGGWFEEAIERVVKGEV